MNDNNAEENDNFSRPQTVSLTRYKQEYETNNETESGLSIGEAFFPQPKNEIAMEDGPPKHTDTKTDDPNLIELNTPEDQTTGLSGNQAEPVKDIPSTGNGSPRQRPKTVTFKSTNQRKQRLVNMGAVSGQDVVVVDSDTLEGEQPPSNNSGLSPPNNSGLSPKPKCDQCYICGKEFLLSSIKVHEKQCSKKFQKEDEKRSSDEPARGDFKVERTETKSNGSKNSPSTNSQVSKLPKKLELEACYLCGRKFFVHSLGIHETQCIKNWKATKTPDAKHKSLSERARVDYDEFMVSGEEHFHEQLKVEVKKEKPASKNQESNAETMASPKCEKIATEARCVGRQKTVPCSMCAVQLFPHSLKVHEKKCRSRIEGEEGKGGDEGGKSETMESPKHRIAAEGGSVGRQKGLKTVPCSMCAVQLFPHSLKVHEKKCRSRIEGEGNSGDEGVKSQTMESPKRKIGSEASSVSRQKELKTVPCYMCGVQLFPHSLKVHEKKCRSRSEGNAGEKGLKSSSEPAVEDDLVSDLVTGARDIASERAEDKQEEQTFDERLSHKTEEIDKRPSGPSSTRISRKPRTVICYICGQEFLKSSLAVHEKQCANKNKAKTEQVESKSTNGKKAFDTGTQTRKPKPAAADLPRVNTPPRKPKPDTDSPRVNTPPRKPKPDADSSRVNTPQKKPKPDADSPRVNTPPRKPKTRQCFICGKEMLLSSHAIHEQQCQKKSAILKNINQAKGQQKPRSPRQVRTKPKTAVCYICGEHFLSSSIKVHETQCEKKWNANGNKV